MERPACARGGSHGAGRLEQCAARNGRTEKSWQGAQSYLHITLQHEEINKADTLLHQCALYAETQDGSAFSDAAVQLTLQFDRLAEMERLSIKNVL